MARILIVDDEESARLLLGSILESDGHEVFFARNGEEATKAFLRRNFGVVVTDLQMPSGDGLELIDALTGLDPDVPIIAVSGTGPELLGKAETMGAHRTLPKPVDRTELLAAVDEALASGVS